MSLCIYRKGAQCCCQPDEGTLCPNLPRYRPVAQPNHLGGKDGVAMVQDQRVGVWVKLPDVLALFSADGVAPARGGEQP